MPRQLTHWNRVTYIYVSKLTIICSDNGLLPGQRHVIIWTNAGILLTSDHEEVFFDHQTTCLVIWSKSSDILKKSSDISIQLFMVKFWDDQTICLMILNKSSDILQNHLQCLMGRWLLWTLLLTELSGTKFSEILIEIHTFSFKEMHLKMSAKWRPFCLGLNVNVLRSLCHQWPISLRMLTQIHLNFGAICCNRPISHQPASHDRLQIWRQLLFVMCSVWTWRLNDDIKGMLCQRTGHTKVTTETLDATMIQEFKSRQHLPKLFFTWLVNL